jgi:hypothetical protein
MEFGPIWRAMMRNKGGYLLIALQIAVTMAVMVNAIAIMQERSVKMARPSGIDEANTFSLISVGFKPDMDEKSVIQEDLDVLRNLPGVVNAVKTNSFPLRQGGWSEGLHREPGVGKSVSSSAIYFVDEHGLDTFALNLIDGENFAPEQVAWDSDSDDFWPATVIISEALGEDLFPDHEGSYVGQTFWFNDDNPVNIVGVVERLQAPWPSWTGVERSMLVPLRRGDSRREQQGSHHPWAGNGERSPQSCLSWRRRDDQDVVVHRDIADLYYRAGNRRACELQRCAAHAPDRHTPGARGNKARDRALLHAGKFPREQCRHRCRRYSGNRP